MPRTNAQRFFLTWSQVPLADVDLEGLADFLYALQPTPVYIEVVHEFHQDNGHHFHAVVEFPTRVQRDLTWFNWRDRTCDIKGIAPSDIFNRRHYIRKGQRTKEEEHTPKAHKTAACDYDLEPCVRGTPPPYNAETSNGKLTWADLVLGSATEEEFFDGVRTHFARDWVLSHDKIIGYGKKWYNKAPDFVATHQPAEFIPSPEVDAWIAEVKAKVCLEVPHATPLLVNGLLISSHM